MKAELNGYELLVPGHKLSNALIAAGFTLIEQGRMHNGHRNFVFLIARGQEQLLKKVMNGVSR